MPSALVFDCEGARASADELAFFKEADPWGFILFARHCESADAIRAHCDELREAVGRDAPIMIDQEGGRVTRMKPPVFRTHPAAGKFGELWRLDPQKAKQAARLNAFLLSRMVSDLGVTVNCVPSLDAPQIDSDPATLGDRALSMHPDTIAALGADVIAGALAGGALPVVKHMPGLGRALCDSHEALPTVTAEKGDLQREDFAPFKALSDAPAGMTCHAVFDAFDPSAPVTLSKTMIDEVIRGEIGFDGLLFTDDLKMKALSGDYRTRAEGALAAGCDIALCCNLSLAEKQSIGAPKMTQDAVRRADLAMAQVENPARDDVGSLYAELDDLLKPVAN